MFYYVLLCFTVDICASFTVYPYGRKPYSYDIENTAQMTTVSTTLMMTVMHLFIYLHHPTIMKYSSWL